LVERIDGNAGMQPLNGSPIHGAEQFVLFSIYAPSDSSTVFGGAFHWIQLSSITWTGYGFIKIHPFFPCIAVVTPAKHSLFFFSFWQFRKKTILLCGES
jgi:hypothetical protein